MKIKDFLPSIFFTSSNIFRPQVLYRNCLNELSFPASVSYSPHLSIKYRKNEENVIQNAYESEIFSASSSGLIICPKEESLYSLTIYYKTPTFTTEETFTIEDIPKPTFHFFAANKEIVNGETIDAGQPLYISIETDNKAIKSKLDKRYLYGDVKLALFNAEQDSSPAELFTLMGENLTQYLCIRTDAIADINTYSYGTIILKDVYRVAYNNELFLLENAETRFNFRIKPNHRIVLPPQNDTKAVLSNCRDRHETPQKKVATEQIKPQCLNMDMVRKQIGYPLLARQKDKQGEITLRLLLNKEGEVVDYVVVKSEDNILCEQVIKYIDKLRFSPAIQNHKPILFWMLVPFKFKLV